MYIILYTSTTHYPPPNHTPCHTPPHRQIQVYGGVFHGDEPLCQGETRPILLADSAENIWHWNENIEFDINVKDLPHGARLCIAIYAIFGGGKQKSKKKGKEAS